MSKIFDALRFVVFTIAMVALFIGSVVFGITVTEYIFTFVGNTNLSNSIEAILFFSSVMIFSIIPAAFIIGLLLS